MLFNSLSFVLFFPISVIVYFILPHRLRYIWLLINSYYFYMCWNAEYAILLGISTLITYLSGVLIEKAKDKPSYKRLWVGLSFTLNLAILFFFKYFNFASSTIGSLFEIMHIDIQIPVFDVLLPVGISFYTFQALSYTMDVYRQEINAEHNILKYALFVSFFPQLVAGPIERSKNLLNQINDRHVIDYNRMKNGLLLMLWGYFEKLVIADRAAIYVNEIFSHYKAYAFIEIVLAVFLFAVQIYCDFGGYSHIAIGAAQVFGFSLMSNFRQPYFATSIQDFWRRWHISLSTWFRDYLYIPLGGSRCGKLKKYINLLITFFASGIWHGASWNFVIWGGMNGVFQVVGDIFKPIKKKIETVMHIKTDCFSWHLLRRILTFLLVCFTWIFFRASSFDNAMSIISQMTSCFNPWVIFDGSLYACGLTATEMNILLYSIVLLIIVDILHEKGYHIRDMISKQNSWFRWTVYFVGLITVLIIGIYGPAFDIGKFIYFQF